MKPMLFDLVSPPVVPDSVLGELVFSNTGLFILILAAVFLLSCVTVISIVIVLFCKKKNKANTENASTSNRVNEKNKKEDIAD
ncbi:MAG: hypothetical protein IKM27_05025 [Clostridia bacterium]|nr:hypothetical protein [Clostridia bacterium]